MNIKYSQRFVFALVLLVFGYSASSQQPNQTEQFYNAINQNWNNQNYRGSSYSDQ
jgi:hypothetical protein